jgi:hypothetical protein
VRSSDTGGGWIWRENEKPSPRGSVLANAMRRCYVSGRGDLFGVG